MSDMVFDHGQAQVANQVHPTCGQSRSSKELWTRETLTVCDLMINLTNKKSLMRYKRIRIHLKIIWKLIKINTPHPVFYLSKVDGEAVNGKST